MGLPALDAFPRKVWSRIHIRITRTLSTEEMLVGDPRGFLPLRQAIASYLGISRGIACSAQNVFVTSGFQSTLGMLARAYIKPGDAVWFEDPGYFLARRGFESADAKLVPVPVDREGLDVRAGTGRAPSARMVYVTPSHQAPLGVGLSSSRRLELLKWASAAGAWIFEDDYDSEFRYGSQPLPALKSLDGNDRVFYAGTFSKVLFPGLRLGYLVPPDSQVEHIGAIVQALYRDRPVPMQATVAEFMTGGHFARHVRRMRVLYSERRSALAAGLRAAFGPKLRIHLEAGGMHLLARVPDGADDVACATAAAKSGLAVTALSQWCLESDQTGLLLSFTNIASRDARDLATRLKRAIEPCF
jgi:GntR family transcriptional regulator/MocR family aminotransferase